MNGLGVRMALISAGLALLPVVGAGAQPVTLDVRTMPRVGAVDERYQSYNVEMLEITGGRFWKPYRSGSTAEAKAQPGKESVPAGMDPNQYEYRPPLSLDNARLR